MLQLGHLGWLGTAGTSRGRVPLISLGCLFVTDAYPR